MARAAITVIGAGPAGLAAAVCAAECGRRVVLVDENPLPGGQIWRAKKNLPAIETEPWRRRAQAAGVEWRTGCQAAQATPERLWLESAGEAETLAWEQLILATGARELLLPFPGWTLPNCCGAGGLQALVKAGLAIAGQRVVVAGSGPLTLAVAAYLQQQGARVLLVAEQAAPMQAAAAALLLFSSPARVRQAWRMRDALRGVEIQAGCWVEAAEGAERLQRVRLRRGRRRWSLECDYLACGFGLRPNSELGQLLGCALNAEAGLQVDRWQQTSVARIWCAGDASGVAGVEAALLAGQIAGYAAAGRQDLAAAFIARRDRQQRASRRLLRRLALRQELRRLAADDTWFCRCEDVPIGEAQAYASWREAKLQTRCGMGACQGRICGAAGRFLWGWEAAGVRPPIVPVRVGTLALTETGEAQ